MKNKANWFWAVPLIAVGLVWQLRNLGYVSYDFSHLVVSWQMLLIYLGVVSFVRRQSSRGLVLCTIGLVFLLPEFGVLRHDWLRVNWPLLLIVFGIAMLVKPHIRKKYYSADSNENSCCEDGNSTYSCEEGFVETNVCFGSVKQIVLDPVFRGAKISNTFGGTIIDLRRSALEAPETYIDVECAFGGVEIYLPSGWFLQSKATAILGGYEDKRFLGNAEVDKEHILILRGNITFGGVVFKS